MVDPGGTGVCIRQRPRFCSRVSSIDVGPYRRLAGRHGGGEHHGRKRTLSRIISVLAGLTLAGTAALVPATAAHASTAADVHAGSVVLADGTRGAVPAARPATALDAGNDGAWVSGVGQCNNIGGTTDCWTWIDTTNGTPCPSGHFCIYTNTLAREGGKVFSFYHCRNGGSDWALQAWNGTGFWNNNNTGGKHGLIKGINHNVLVDTSPGQDG